MIFKLEFEDRTEYAQAKNEQDLSENYEAEFGDFKEAKKVEEISEEEAKLIMLRNPEFNENDPDDMEEFSLYDAVCGDMFCIVASTEWT
ncbi:hypothetical protein VS868_11880 [Salinimicrobium sp. 3283s]|uniref:hypothetical protein n=1 Tax=Salinimicrobium sp. 3283s TaxID=3114359 RepID=UPI0031EFC165